MASLSSLFLALSLVAAAQDTGAPHATGPTGDDPLVAGGAPAKPSHLPPGASWPVDWPPDTLPTVPLPENTAVAVRSPAPRLAEARVGELSAKVLQAWPLWVDKGYLPLRVTLENHGARPLEVDLTLAPEYSSGAQRVERALALAPRARVELDLVVPAFDVVSEPYGLVARARGSDAPLEIGGLGAPHWAGSAESNVLRVARELPPLGAIDAWTTATPQALWSAARFEDLPRGTDALAAWTSIDLVALDVAQGFPPPDALDPLLGWVRLGGALIVRGPEQPLPDAIAAWTSPRFALPLKSEPEAGRAYAMGAGLVVLTAREEGWGDAPLSGLAWELLHRASRRSLVPAPRAEGYWGPLEVEMPGVGELPRAVVSLLLIGLALLLGPINLGLVWLSRRPPLLLVSTPLLAVGSSGVLVAWGLLRDGLDLKQQIASVTVLDQRSGRASTQEGRMLYAGRAQAGGLRPGPGTVVVPVDDDQDRSWMIARGEDARLLGARFLPSRQKVELRVLTDRPTSRALELEHVGGRAVVTNRLGAPISLLHLCDPAGQCWRGTAIADGARVELRALARGDTERWDEGDSVEALERAEAVRSLYGQQWLPDGAWLARLDGHPFSDELGLEAVDLPGPSFVYGLLEGP